MTGKKATSSERMLAVVPSIDRPSQQPRINASEKPSLFPRRSYIEGAVIVDVGETTDMCWIIVSGSATLTVPDPQTGVPFPCVKLGPGLTFGIDLHMNCAPSIFQIIACEPVTVYEIHPEDLTSDGDKALLRSRLDYLRHARDLTFPRLLEGLKTLAEAEAHWSREAEQRGHTLRLTDEQREKAEERIRVLCYEIGERDRALVALEQETAKQNDEINDLKRVNARLAHDNIAIEFVQRGQKLKRVTKELAAVAQKAKDYKANAETAMNYINELMGQLADAEKFIVESVDGDQGEELLGHLSNLFIRMMESNNPRTSKLAVDALGTLNKLPTVVAKRKLER